jgi:hypothetical protein
MGSISKSFPLILILIIVISSLIMAKPAFAQNPTPSVPEFTLKLVGPPYLLNTTYSLDPNTGQIVAKIGYTNPYSALEINVKNQPFDSSYGNLYYNVRVKNHSATDNWVEAYRADYFFPKQSNDSDYTNVGFSIEGYNFIGTLAGSQVDIQVEAMLGGIFRKSIEFASGYEFRGATSGWSSTQTVTIPANIPLSPTPTPSSSTLTPTPTPTVTSVSSAPNSSLLLITTIALVVIAFLLVIIISLLLHIRHRKLH